MSSSCRPETIVAIILDDADLSGRAERLCVRLKGASFSTGPELIHRERKWPMLPDGAEDGSVIAFVHWSEAAARILVEELRRGRGAVKRYVTRLRAIVAYRGGVSEAPSRLAGVHRSGRLMLVQPEEGAAVPILPVRKLVTRGDELSATELDELRRWALAANRQARRLPAMILGTEDWLLVGKALLTGYLAARLPDELGVEIGCVEEASRFSKKVVGDSYWQPLLAAVDPGASANLPSEVLYYFASRLESRLGVRVEDFETWLRSSCKTPEQLDRRVVAVWRSMRERSRG